MRSLSLNNIYFNSLDSKEDVLSVFRVTPKKNIKIEEGMTANEISEIVSEKIIANIKEQFEATKIQFEAKK